VPVHAGVSCSVAVVETATPLVPMAVYVHGVAAAPKRQPAPPKASVAPAQRLCEPCTTSSSGAPPVVALVKWCEGLCVSPVLAMPYAHASAEPPAGSEYAHALPAYAPGPPADAASAVHVVCGTDVSDV